MRRKIGRWTLANVVSAMRIGLALLTYYAGFVLSKTFFLVFFAVAGLSDVVDGMLARHYKEETKFGAFLDSVADVVYYPTALLLYFFVPAVIVKHTWLIASVLCIFALAMVSGLLRGKLVIPHLVSSKAFAVILYLFVLYTLIIGYAVTFFYATIVIGLWAAIEQFIMLAFRRPRVKQRWCWE